MLIEPRSYQTECVSSIYSYFNKHAGNPICALPTGCHAKGHLILMYDGTTRPIEDILVGDLVMGPDSLPRQVLMLARGRQEMRKVIPNKAESFVVNLDHMILSHSTRQNKKEEYECQLQKDEVISIRQYEESSDWFRHLHKLKFGSVEFKTSDLPIDPYILGLFLGDGSMCNGGVHITTMDIEIDSAIREFAKNHNVSIRQSAKTGTLAWDLHIVDYEANRSIQNKVTKILRDLGVMEQRAWEKHIPSVYKISDKQQRLSILAGLIDTDGYYSFDDNYFEYTTSSPQLAEDVKFVCRSLGLRCQIKVKHTTRRDSYRLNITGDIDEIPTRLPRKFAAKSKKQKSCSVMGFTVEKLPEDDYYGFSLSGDKLYLDSNFVIHHNTGKSVCIALFLESIFRQWGNQKVLVLTHVKELIEQNYAKLLTLWPTAPAGIYSAGLKRHDTLSPIIFGGIGSVVKHAAEFGRVDLVIIDEAHLVSPNDKTMYQKFLQGLQIINPYLKVIGFTATPWRLGQGHIVEDGLFSDVCFDITGMEAFNRLIEEGYLAQLVPKRTNFQFNIEGVHSRGGEFIESELQNAVDKEELTYQALQEACEYRDERKHWLIFAAGTDHTDHISNMLNSFGVSALPVHSKMSDKQRDENITRGRIGDVQALVNNNVLTTGFDSPWIDLILVLRPTSSAVLWVQMLGRGTRPYKCESYEKENCLVLDFAGNTRRLGPINDPVLPRKKGSGKGEAPVKECDICQTFNHASARICIGCGAEFKFTTKLKQSASTEELIKQDLPVMEVFKVDHITFTSHNKLGAPCMLKVTYYCGLRMFSQYVCFEHEGFARRKAGEWWHERSDTPTPATVHDAIVMVDKLPTVTHLRVWTNKKYPEIMKCCFDGSEFGAKTAGGVAPTVDVLKKGL